MTLHLTLIEVLSRRFGRTVCCLKYDLGSLLFHCRAAQHERELER